MTVAPRAVVISRPTEYQLLLERHGTHRQVEFFLQQRDRSIEEVQIGHRQQLDALQAVGSAIAPDWRRASVGRQDLDRWLFEPEDVVVAVGPDGLVANVAKYLNGQPVLGVNPSGSDNAGVLVTYNPGEAGQLLRRLGRCADGPATAAGLASARAMVQIVTDTGQRLSALNEIFVGQRTHQSARYRLTVTDSTGEMDSTSGIEGGRRTEYQSSSGLLVSTGTGSTGWSRSLWTERHCGFALPDRQSMELAWFVREAWPSPSTGTQLVEGLLPAGQTLTVRAASDALVAFGDGVESDRLELSWGQSATIELAEQQLALIWH